jgi:hypothetical protein
MPLSYGTDPDQDISYTYAKFFNYPDNIAKDWAEGMANFGSHWLVSLNYKYGASSPDKDFRKNWPENARTLAVRIKAVRDDLWFKASGLTREAYDAQLAERDAFIEKMIADIKKE